MKPGRLLLVGLGVLALALALWFLAQDDPPVQDAAGPVSGERPAPEAAGPTPPQALAPAELATPSERRAPIAGGGAPQPVPPTGALDLDAATWIRGRLSFPEGQFPQDEVLLSIRPIPPEGRPFANEVERARATERSIWSHAAMAPDGSFRLPVPADFEEAAIELRASRWRLYHPHFVAAHEVDEEVRMRPVPGASLGGFLRPTAADASAADFEAVELFIGPTNGGSEPVRMLRPNAEGRFLITGLTPGFKYHLIATSPGFAPTSEYARVKEARLQTLDLALDPPAQVSGRVVSAGEQPVEGARVEAAPWVLPGKDKGWERALQPVAETDARGRFRLDGVPGENLDFVAEAADFSNPSIQELSLKPGETRTGVRFLMSRGPTLNVLVLHPDGRPAPGATVRLGWTPKSLFGRTKGSLPNLELARGTTDAEGRAVFDDLEHGAYGVRATLEENGRWWRATLDDVHPELGPIELRLAPAAFLEGRVVDARGEPVPDFAVLAMGARDDGRRQPADPRWVRITASHDGSFALGGLGEGPGVLRVEAEGFAPSGSLGYEVSLAAPSPPLEVVLQRWASVAGRVVDRDGRPVEGALVIQQPPLDTTHYNQLNPDDSTPVLTGKDGEFRFEEVPPSERELRTETPGFAPSAPLRLSLEDGEEREGVELVLRRAGTIVVRISKDGVGVPGRVGCSHLANRQDIRPIDSDASGIATLEGLAPGGWAIYLDNNDSGNTYVTAVDLAEGATEEVEFDLTEKVAVRVFGRVTSGGRGQRCGLAFIPAQGFGPGVEESQCGADGGYELEIPEPGEYRVVFNYAGEEDFRSQRVTIPAVVELELDFELPAGVVAGTVTDPEGSPEFGAALLLRAEDPLQRGLMADVLMSAMTDRDGHYRFDRVEAGRYRVSVGGLQLPWGRSSGSQHGLQISRVFALESGDEVVGIDFVVSPSLAARGRVVDQSGKPVVGAGVFARDASGRLLDSISGTKTDAAGNFVYLGLSPGWYQFFARTDSLAGSGGESVSVPQDEGRFVELVLARGTRLAVEVLGAERSVVTVYDAQGRRVSGLGLAEEVLENLLGGESELRRLGPFPPGRYRVEVLDAEDPTRRLERALELGGSPEERLVFEFD